MEFFIYLNYKLVWIAYMSRFKENQSLYLFPIQTSFMLYMWEGSGKSSQVRHEHQECSMDGPEICTTVG